MCSRLESGPEGELDALSSGGSNVHVLALRSWQRVTVLNTIPRTGEDRHFQSVRFLTSEAMDKYTARKPSSVAGAETSSAFIAETMGPGA